MSRYFLGVDVGATKSHALIAAEDGQALGFGRGGPGNYEVVGWDGLRATLSHIVEQALAAAGLERGHIAGAGLGIAGYDWPGVYEPHREIIASLGLGGPFVLVNDAVIPLLAGSSEGWGVAVVAGTSNNCRGLDRQGREGRVTGGGRSFAENGGAVEMIARAVELVALDWTRRGPPTRLGAALAELAGASDVADLLEGLYLGRHRLTAQAAPLIFQVAAQGDDVAADLVRATGRELGSLAVGVIRQLGFEDVACEVIQAGSLYDGSPALVEEMRATIHAVAPRARLVRLHAPPVVGGVLLGMSVAGARWLSVRERLIETTRLLRARQE